MKKIFRIVLGLFFALTTTCNYAQINVQKSKVVISEAEIISLSKTLKKYRITNYLRVDETRKKELDSLSLRIKELTELLSLQKDATSNSKELASKTVTDLVSKKDVVEKSIVSPKESEPAKVSENALALNKLEQEVVELKELVSEVLNNQVTISNSPVETKEVETFIQTPPVIIEKTVLKTDTIYVLKENDGSKIIDSLNMKLLAVKNDQLITQQLLIDSLKSQLLEKKVSVPTEIKKEAEVTTLKLYFFNNEFALNEINKAILDELFLSISSATVNFNIKGFASVSGNADYNKTLSSKRSQAVYNYLVLKGIKKDALKSASFGVDYKEEDASKARRVEIEVVKML